MAKLLQYSCLESRMDRRAWRATVYRVAKSQTRLSTHTHTHTSTHTHTAKKSQSRIQTLVYLTSKFSVCEGFSVELK